MITKRIIPCLDVKDGRVVKGVSFVDLKDAGDPVELAAYYDRNQADELVFLDISASHEGRKTMLDVVKRAAEQLRIPFTVGGGIRTEEDMYDILRSGADKVSVNTSAVLNPELIESGAERFGRQCVVIAIDAKYDPEEKDWFVYTHGGRKRTDKRAVDWAVEAVARGAGEILLTSMDRDGHKNGYDLPLTRLIAEKAGVPVIASGGAGKVEHFVEVFLETEADAALAASIFHFQEVGIDQVKKALKENGVNVR
ncbi:imidazole glycerol phosphate synthase subunit HisF [Thermoactinomyces intermedius]|jgi:imidazole glycerol-phosphate synthase subunit HisF|uniref:Imidazole glycerol phosphate synthase subunit HisF n=1 Tax=Thermoactinomyces intermedius TaxID=2024 RepID=A0A8I1DEK9_THEIN|nr:MULTISPECIES: imidazole glycerol phosphate synthase subunit HisF [Thermoactinomyces]MBA4548250.1 imidazole glycerol phosphate synthase subunit HisF [Thermoactinomyces intermedius]MBA4835186.1 imidazole glycerol phosphate synthase subunit HisF [Thermoactinomyces intermedius]MBH8595094.1 imidazole glycerol phosphate synthase subunit HisF [Thermoactinomyces intermedius]MBH8600249.1 imidazole glycerol phosphate synthase subunit HisF [Thermoactinomyces sp. CICC 23799]